MDWVFGFVLWVVGSLWSLFSTEARWSDRCRSAYHTLLLLPWFFLVAIMCGIDRRQAKAMARSPRVQGEGSHFSLLHAQLIHFTCRPCVLDHGKQVFRFTSASSLIVPFTSVALVVVTGLEKGLCATDSTARGGQFWVSI